MKNLKKMMYVANGWRQGVGVRVILATAKQRGYRIFALDVADIPRAENYHPSTYPTQIFRKREGIAVPNSKKMEKQLRAC